MFWKFCEFLHTLVTLHTKLYNWWVSRYSCVFMHIFLHSLWISNYSQTWLCNLWVYGHCCDFKSLLHIIFNKWSFIDRMSNLMAICAMWIIWSWNFIHIVNLSIPIPWNSFNYVFILLIKSRVTVLHSYSHMNTFYYYLLQP